MKNNNNILQLFHVGNAPKAKKAKKDKKTKEKPMSDDSFYSNLNIHGTLSYDVSSLDKLFLI